MRRVASGVAAALAVIGALVGARFALTPPASGPPPCPEPSLPCTLGETDPAALRHALSMGTDAAARIRAGDAAGAADWLRAQDRVVEVLTPSPGVIGYRLAGTRHIWLDSQLLSTEPVAREPVRRTPLAPGEAGSASRIAAWLSEVLSPPVLHAQALGDMGGVVGRDRNGDGRIDDFDPRRALILSSDVFGNMARPARVAGIVGSMRGYDHEDGLRQRVGRQATVSDYTGWSEYDLVYVTARTSVVCGAPILPDDDAHGAEVLGLDRYCDWAIATGSPIPPVLLNGQTPRTPGQQPSTGATHTPTSIELALQSQGIEIFAVADPISQDLEWRLFVTKPFFRTHYPQGVPRALIVLDLANPFQLQEEALVLAGDPERSGVFFWLSDITDVEHSLETDAFFGHLADGWSASAAMAALTSSSRAVLGLTEVRAREVATIYTAPRLGASSRPVASGEPIQNLLDPGSVPGTMSIVVVVDGIVGDERTRPLYGHAPSDLNVRLLFDDEVLAQRPLLASATPGSDGPIPVAFDRIPLPEAPQAGNYYLLEAVVDLPGGGESRSSRWLEAPACRVPSRGDFAGTLSGVGARAVRRDSRGALAKILPSATGGWTLQMESRERDDNDLSLLLTFDGDIQLNGRITIDDPDLMSPGIGGQVGRFDRANRINWSAGTVTITFDTILDVPGAAFQWVCGSVQGELAGVRPNGQIGGQTADGHFDGRFWAEWYRDR